MKTSIATSLSIVGVIAAGAAAYAVNTSVLGAAVDPTPAAAEAVVAPAAAPVSNQGTQGGVSGDAVTTEANVVNDTTTTYKVGNAGSVVVDTSSGQIVVTGILPAAGFTSEPASTDANGVVKVHFVSSTQRIEFVARMVNGAVVTDVVNETPPPGQPAKPPHHDDDDHGDDDEHDDRHEDDDDDHEDYDGDDD